MNIREYIDKHHLQMTSTRIPARLDRKPDKWDREASHWVVSIRTTCRGHCDPLVTQYSMGSAHKGAPKIADVLDSLRWDASSADNTFEDWCGELGYDSDSRQALANYDACRAIADRLRQMLGSEAFAELMDVEPL